MQQDLFVMPNYGKYPIHLQLFCTLISIFLSPPGFGQHSTFLKTTGKKHLHYIVCHSEKVIVYKMGSYFDKAGSGPAILKTDTLTCTNTDECNGKFFTLLKRGPSYTLISDKGKKFKTEVEHDSIVTTELNHAYCLKSYFDLSDQLNKEFTLYHYTFRNGYYAWEKHSNKSIRHDEFVVQINREISRIYDSISQMQTAFLNTTNFITAHAGQASYTILKDSISTLPLDHRPDNGYFDESVYQMAKANPEYFYKLLQDFPSHKVFLYFAVDHDKKLIKSLRQVEGYDDLKREFLKEYKTNRGMLYRTLGGYAVIIGLITWLIAAQP